MIHASKTFYDALFKGEARRGSARLSLGEEEVRCIRPKPFIGIQRVRLPPGKG
jgi:hypothetical protein